MTTVAPCRFDTDRWLMPDLRMEQFLTLNKLTGSARDSTADDWLRLWKRGHLDLPVPAQIIELFEQARACICYGYFFYPLYALGIEQLMRVADAAVAVRCEQLDAPKSVHTLSQRINWLAKSNYTRGFDAQHWHRLRLFRNEATHHTRASVIPPAMAAPVLWNLAADIQALFADLPES